jgi:hypothetical protein
MYFWKAWLRYGRHQLVACAIIAAASLTLLGWGFWPAAARTKILELGMMPIDSRAADTTGTSPGTASAYSSDEGSADSGIEVQSIILEYPTWLREGDDGVIQLQLHAASYETPGGATKQPSTAPGNRNVIAEASVDLPGAQVRPFEAVSTPLVNGKPVDFVWSLVLTESKTYRGTAWLFLILAEPETEVGTRIPISAQSVQVAGNAFLGMSGKAARVGGALGLGGSVVLALPFFEKMFRGVATRSNRQS